MQENDTDADQSSPKQLAARAPSERGQRALRWPLRLLDPLCCYAACGLLFAAGDAWRERWVLSLRWLPAAEVWPQIAYSAAVYASCAALAGAAGWTLWGALRAARLARPLLREALTGAGPAFAFVAVIWTWSCFGEAAETTAPELGTLPPASVPLTRLAASALLAGGAAGAIGAWARRRKTARAALAAAAAAGVAIAAALMPHPKARDWPPSSRPNIVLITIDALRYDHLSCNGGPAPTPHLDALAAKGVRFTHAWSAAPWTRPSFASLMMSVYPTVHGVGENEIGCWRMNANVAPDALTTLAEALRTAGYSTGAFVCNAQVDGRFGFSRGFDDYVMYEQVTRMCPALSLAEAADPGRVLSRRARRLLRGRLRAEAGGGYDSFAGQAGVYLEPSGLFLAGAALRWMRIARPPFFVWIHLMEVNQYPNFDMPMSAPPTAGGLAGVRQLARGVAPGARCLVGPDDSDMLQAEPELLQERIKGFKDRYKTNVIYDDALVGCILAEIDASPAGSNTIVAFTSDHGEEFGEHGGTWHGWTQYEEVTHVPLLIRGPRIQGAGKVVSAPCSLLDVAPTLVEAAGAARPLSFRGVSLLPIIAGRKTAPREICSEFMTPERPERKALRLEMFKCITPASGSPAELYNLAEDPHEQRNLAQRLPYRLEEMLSRLNAWQERQHKMADVVRKGSRQRRFVMDDQMRRMLKSLGYLE